MFSLLLGTFLAMDLMPTLGLAFQVVFHGGWPFDSSPSEGYSLSLSLLILSSIHQGWWPLVICMSLAEFLHPVFSMDTWKVQEHCLGLPPRWLWPHVPYCLRHGGVERNISCGNIPLTDHLSC